MQLFPMWKTTAIGSAIIDAQCDGLIDPIATKVDTNVLRVPVTISRSNHTNKWRLFAVLIGRVKMGRQLVHRKSERVISIW